MQFEFSCISLVVFMAGIAKCIGWPNEPITTLDTLFRLHTCYNFFGFHVSYHYKRTFLFVTDNHWPIAYGQEMAALFGILITIGMFFLSAVIETMTQTAISRYMILASGLWAAIDSSKIQLRKYPSGISYHPVILFLAVSLLWVIGFPWYLAVRYKIKKGLLAPKPE